MAFWGDPMPEQHHGSLKTHAGNAAKLQDEACLSTHMLCTGKESVSHRQLLKHPLPSPCGCQFPVSHLSPEEGAVGSCCCVPVQTHIVLLSPVQGLTAGHSTPGTDQGYGLGAASGCSWPSRYRGLCRSHPSLPVQPVAGAESHKHKQDERHSQPRVCFALLQLLLTNSAGQSITTAFLCTPLPRAFCGTSAKSIEVKHLCPQPDNS